MRHLTVLVLLAGLVACSDEIAEPTVENEPESLPAPAVPTGLHVRDVGQDYVLLAWDLAGAPSPGILVQARTAGDDAWPEPVVRRPGATTYLFRAEPLTDHEVRIAAVVDGVASAWTSVLPVTTRREGYWEVNGGILVELDGDACVFFEFGRANHFASGGSLRIQGPVGWNQNRDYHDPALDGFRVELRNRGAVSGDYRLSFVSDRGREFDATIVLDATLTVPEPTWSLRQTWDGTPFLSWTCCDAHRAELRLGSMAAPLVEQVARTGQRILDDVPMTPPAMLMVVAVRDPVDLEAPAPRDRQAARTESGVYYLAR